MKSDKGKKTSKGSGGKIVVKDLTKAAPRATYDLSKTEFDEGEGYKSRFFSKNYQIERRQLFFGN